MVFKAKHPIAGIVQQLNIPIKMSGTPAEYRIVEPLLGEHNEEIFRQSVFNYLIRSLSMEGGELVCW